jgi:hypothetical protein
MFRQTLTSLRQGARRSRATPSPRQTSTSSSSQGRSILKKNPIFLCSFLKIFYVLCASIWDQDRHRSPMTLLSRIRIRFGNAVSEPGAWKVTKINKKTLIFLPFCLSLYVFNPHFYYKIQLFLTLKSDQDPDLHRSALVGLPGSGSGFRSTLR